MKNSGWEPNCQIIIEIEFQSIFVSRISEQLAAGEINSLQVASINTYMTNRRLFNGENSFFLHILLQALAPKYLKEEKKSHIE